LGCARALDPIFGAGSCDDDSGVKIRHVRLTLANGLPDVVGGVNLSYADPADVDVDAHEAGPETLVVHNADEVLYRIRLNRKAVDVAQDHRRVHPHTEGILRWMAKIIPLLSRESLCPPESDGCALTPVSVLVSFAKVQQRS
jgi:hypothetical protein